MTNYRPAKLAYKLFEPGDGADEKLCPIIFLHGLTGTKDAWLDMPQVIADKTKRKAYAIDARNHGDSEFDDVFNAYANATDLIHFMEKKNISKAALVGHSMGGTTSMLVAFERAEKVEMLFSVEMSTSKVPKEIVDKIIISKKLTIAAVKEIPPGLPEKEAVKYALDWAYDKMEKDPKLKESVLKETVLNARTRLRCKPDGTYDVYYNKNAILTCLENFQKDAKDLIGQYNGPAFFIYGSVSPFNVANDEERIKKLFPKAELIEFEGATHDIVGDCWEKFIDTVSARLIK